MKGTEKQVTWAEEIQNRVVSILEKAVEDAKSTGNAMNAKGFQMVLDVVKGFDGSAADMIDTFKAIRESGDFKRDAMDVVLTARAQRVKTFASDQALGAQLVKIFAR